MGLFSSKKSSTNTSTVVNNYDQRSVNDAGGGLIGDGSSIDNSISYASFTNSTDGGAFDVVRSVADGLNRIGLAQVDAARDLAGRVDSFQNAGVSLAMRAQQDAAGFNELAAGRAFDLARSSQAQAFANSGEALGFARETFGQVVDLARGVIGQAGQQASEAAGTAAAAYANAADTSSGDKTLKYAGLAAVAIVAAVALMAAWNR